MMEVTDEMVIKAVHAYQDEEIRVFGEVRTPNNGARHGAMRAALEAALSHAAGQDGEQCRAASVAFRTDCQRDGMEVEAMCDHLIRDSYTIAEYPEIADRLSEVVLLIRALSRGVPEGE